MESIRLYFYIKKVFPFLISLLVVGIVLFSCVCKKCNAFIYRNLEVDSSNIPLRNKQILRYVAQHGREISPTYQSAVCTEYVIKVLNNFTKLTSKQKSQIRIITTQNLDSLLQKDSEITKGIYTALGDGKQGKKINEIDSVKAGDFVQFWNVYRGKLFGHCGIVRAVNTRKGIISLYSSSPRTNGHGIQTYAIPEYIYFVRLK